MNDIVREVEQDIQSERYQRIFVEHGKKLIAGAVIILLAVSAKTVYHSMQKKKSLESGTKFVSVFDGGDADSYNDIIKQGQKGFAPLATLMKAGIENSHEKHDEALKTLSTLEGSSYDKAFKDIAELDKAYILIQKKGDKAEILKVLDGIIGEDKPFNATAQELKAHYLISAGDKKAAQEILIKLAEDKTAPSTISDRAKQTLSTINE